MWAGVCLAALYHPYFWCAKKDEAYLDYTSQFVEKKLLHWLQ